MKQLNIFTESELKTLRYSIGNINHDVDVIKQNINNPEAISRYLKQIDTYIAIAFTVLEDRKGD